MAAAPEADPSNFYDEGVSPMSHKADLSIDFLGVHCENPFFLSSSPVCHNYEMIAKCFDLGWGGVFYKTVGINGMNECSPRFDNVRKEDCGFVGFKNMEQISEHSWQENAEIIKRLKHDYPTKVMGVSIMGANEEEWALLAREMTKAGADMLELNFSCPQMTSHAMGSDVGQTPELVEKYTRAVKNSTHLPVIAKMTPNISHMEVPSRAAVKGGADAISAINTIKSICNIDLENMTGMPVVNGKSSISGYSGAAVKPIALRFIAQLKQDKDLAKIPISGIGGIETWMDAVEFLLLGSENLQVTTSVMQYGYRIVEDMKDGLGIFMDERGYKSLRDFIGKALPNIIPAEDLDRDFQIIPEIDDKKCVRCGRCAISCFDGGHQAIDIEKDTRRPVITDKCVGCHLCLNVCPVLGCISPGTIKWKPGRTPHEVAIKHMYDR